jgi:hypothetical protein
MFFLMIIGIFLFLFGNCSSIFIKKLLFDPDLYCF